MALASDSMNTTQEIISCLDGKPQENIARHGTVMIIGGPTSGKLELAQALVAPTSEPDQITFNIRLAERFPLPAPKAASSRPRIDLFVFIVDTTSRDSWSLFQKSLACMHEDSFGGHLCLVLTKTDQVTRSVVSTDELEELDDFDVPVLRACMESSRSILTVTDNIRQLVKLAGCHLAHVSPDTVRSLHYELCHQTAIVNADD
eukprot:m.557078 g.557078  ORF g.557078 m.557078 type:complete len:203 (-) comp22188_c0_seq14:397-1005(-)